MPIILLKISFVVCLLNVFIFLQMLDTLLMTLIREQQNDSLPGRAEKARTVARRFVRSVARIFVIFSIEMAPGAAKKRGYVMDPLNHQLVLT